MKLWNYDVLPSTTAVQNSKPPPQEVISVTRGLRRGLGHPWPRDLAPIARILRPTVEGENLRSIEKTNRGSKICCRGYKVPVQHTEYYGRYLPINYFIANVSCLLGFLSADFLAGTHLQQRLGLFVVLGDFVVGGQLRGIPNASLGSVKVRQNRFKPTSLCRFRHT